MKRFITQDSLKQVNASAVFSLIKKRGCITRREIESATGFSWGAVSEITKRLTEGGYILETGKVLDVKSSGRTPSYLEINGERNYTAGIDINVSGISIVIINFKEECIYKEYFNMEHGSKDAALKSIFYALDTMFDYALKHELNILSVCAAMQGIVNRTSGVSRFFPQCHDWQDVALVKILEERYSNRFYLEHDPTCILLGEVRNYPSENIILIRVDKGIGMAAIIDGEIISGEGMLEIGHTTLVHDGVKCVCGNRGCAEAYISQNGMMSQTDASSFAELYERYKSGNINALKIFENMSLYFGIMINNIVKIFNPRKIIMCGSMMKYRDTFIDSVKIQIQKMNFGYECPEISIIESIDAAFGAAIIAADKSIEEIEI